MWRRSLSIALCTTILLTFKIEATLEGGRQGGVVLCCVVLCYAVLCCVVLCCVVLCCVVVFVARSLVFGKSVGPALISNVYILERRNSKN